MPNQSYYKGSYAQTNGYTNKPATSTSLPPVVTPPKPVTNTRVAPTSTTTISNTNKINAVPSIIAKTNQLSNKGVRTDPNSGISTLANGQVAPDPDKRDANGLLINPPGALYDRNTGKPLNQGGTGKKLTDSGTSNDDGSGDDGSFEEKQIMDNLDRMQAMSDAGTADMIANIKQKFAQRKAEQTEMNVKANKATTNALLMGGVTGQGSSAQYAPISSQGIISAQENYGIKQLADLDAQENDMIAAAKEAQLTNNFKILEAKNAQIEKIRQEKMKVAAKLNEDIAERNNKAREANITASRDTAVADLVTQGITDPAIMLDYLNFDEQGNQIGDFTADEIAKTMTNIAKKNGLSDNTHLSQEVQEFYQLKKTQNGLPVSILHLPSEAEQIAAYIKLKTAASTKAKGGGGGSGSGGSGTGGTTSSGAYKTDLDALIGNAYNLISSKNGKEAFADSIKKARSEADKISAVASVVLKNSPAPVRQDFINQSVAIKSIDKAISLLDSGVKTGVINNAKQYAYNVAGKDFDPKLAAINAYITSAIQPYRSSITGAAWGDQEDAEYSNLFGSTKYSPVELKDRLKRIKEIMADKSSAALMAQVNPMSDYNPFTSGSSSLGGSAPQDFLNTPIPGGGNTYSPSIWDKIKL